MSTNSNTRSRGIGSAWRQALREGRLHADEANGEHLRCSIATYRKGQASEPPSDPEGEEVAAVLEGEFRIEAAGEQYELARGEAILIPPRAPRTWTCLSERGALYRVVTRLDKLPADPAAGDA
jgi:quercetin dioxygenase-like cupin family protein